jgi:hypothetical protein
MTESMTWMAASPTSSSEETGDDAGLHTSLAELAGLVTGGQSLNEVLASVADHATYLGE